MRTLFTPSGPALRGALLGGLLVTGLAAPFAASAQRVLWSDDNQLPTASRSATRALEHFRAVSIQPANLRAVLAQAPAEGSVAGRNSGTVISLPLPDGTSQRFRITTTDVMHPALAARFPQIKTYAAQGIDDPSASGVLDMTPAGFHAMIMTAENTLFIDPTPDGIHHLVFNRRDINRAALVQAKCYTETTPTVNDRLAPVATAQRRPNGSQLRTYRLAMACTGEYAQTKGGTVAGALAGITTSVNRVASVYRKEVAVSFQLIANNDVLINLDPATDPYTNLSNGAALNTNQTVVDQRVGSANYDIGHLFNTADGGIAQRPSVCINSGKARGSTGLPNPTGDAFDIDYVAHEIGHQFGGNHTFNYDGGGSCAGGTRAAVAAYEPGSGTTIMAYAGICGSAGDIQPNSDPYFHTKSYDEILTHITGTGNCVTPVATGNNPPVVNAGADYIIPKSTPFELTGSATDPDGDALTYSWEQFDLGPAGTPTAPTGDAPIFRSNVPSTSPTRVFPGPLRRTSPGGPAVAGSFETLPSYDRVMNFRLTARDNRPTGGGVEYDGATITVSSVGGPLLVTAPNTSNIIWRAGATELVTWNVANTTAAPINAANVDILLSVDGGATYPFTLLANTPNDGTQQLSIPSNVTATTQARIKVKASGNVFFDTSDQNFTLQVPTSPAFYLSANCGTAATTVCPGSSGSCAVSVGQVLGFTGQVTFSTLSLPTGVTASFSANPVAPGSSSTVTLATAANTPAGTYTINVVGTSGSQTETQQITLVVRNSANVAPAPTSPAPNSARALPQPTFTWSPIPGATSYDIQVSTDPAFVTLLINANVTNNQYTATTVLNNNGRYFWRVRGSADCGTGPFSAASQFYVGNQQCTTYTSANVPVTIGTGGGSTYTSTLPINITGNDPIADINVKGLRITHNDVSELSIALLNPSGRRSQLYTVVCNGPNLSANFDDSAPTVVTCPITTGGTYRPETALSTYTGTLPNGTWSLQVTDFITGNGGSITGWGLEICTITDAILAGRDAQQLQGVAVFPNPSTGEFNLQVDNAQRGTLSLHVTDALGRTVLTEQVAKGAAMLQHRIDLSKLSQGMYQLHLALPGGGTSVQKLMKL
ncbi:T9SS type A sorting domain-containing protein [Hymenobacter busanensis]|uniref:T9SS type A sorting domain-containing protein n=1 Tax=Hymenobacter busanensis TaxID=2607656 RepID=A0A7L4ZW30_9BACT|nr:zinc-dependent metalloprotease family protein [Hymenobacter busanensis]KAA9332231.1 T9SS type A sorting domain-containing protein [Hymenobacter busanensis]QHJ07431.1 T9SS type A sorting domain-containing protein [Hymenobacter busanensis]